MWRTAKDSLLMKHNLRAQHVPIDETCEQCGEQREMLLHSLWLCDHLIEEVMNRFLTYRIALFSTIA